jgi:aspartate/methionine/tyrosine aminotransferase
MTEYKLSGLTRQVAMSGTLAIEARFQELKAEGKDVISLGAGQPDFDSPPAAKAGGTRAIEQGFTRYTDVAGIPSLRAVIARKLKQENGLEYAPSEIVVAAGAKPAIYHALLAFADPGDEVLLPMPAWPSYADMARLVGAKPVAIPISAAQGYKLTPEALEQAARGGDGRSRLLLFSNPCNPTGAVYSPAELGALAEAARRADLSVIVDEIYERLVYGVPYLSLATLPGMRERTVTVNGVSKSFAMTGWRIGYAAGPAPVIKAMRSMQSHTSGNPCSVSQKAAEAALAAQLDGGEGQAVLARMQAAFAARRDLVAGLLDSIAGVSYVRPDGAFYFFVDVAGHYARLFGGAEARFAALAREAAAGAPRSKLLAQYLLEQAGVAVVPGADFGDDRCIRLSFASSEADLKAALGRIAKALAA